MPIAMVRKPSETPNIRNIDDFIPFRYAYGNQNGFVKGKGNELSYSINGTEFKINSGRVVLQGVESDIDANGVSVVIDSISETRYYSIYYEVNLATNTVDVKSTYDIAGFPLINEGDDLTTNSSGCANLELYHFIATNGIISEVNKVVQEIPYPLSGYNISKGSIEDRLTRLGFKQGSISLSSDVTATTNSLTRQGNYILGTLDGIISSYVEGNKIKTEPKLIGNVPESFRPKEKIYIGFQSSIEIKATAASYGTSTSGSYSPKCYVETNGDIYYIDYFNQESVTGLVVNTTAKVKTINFGYEANPIE